MIRFWILRLALVIVILFVGSGMYVYCYEYIMRPSFFNAANLTISGGKRLTENEILKQLDKAFR